MVPQTFYFIRYFIRFRFREISHLLYESKAQHQGEKKKKWRNGRAKVEEAINEILE